ncbi:MAG: hypothetical protein ACRCT6_05380 [Notoacmeibacter sp.]
MWNWFSKHAQAFGALFSAVALAGILFQVYAADQTQRAQSARDIYREFVALTMNRPELATLIWTPELPEKDKAAYEAYVEYLLYTSEQVISVDKNWAGPMRGWLKDHTAFLCQVVDQSAYTSDVESLINDIKSRECK